MPGLILGGSVATSRAMGFSPRVHTDAGELVTYSGDGHLITFAPTGTGKTSGPVITNALKHPGQLIERGADERDRFWNDWSETMIAGATAWLLADRPPEGRRLSALFDLFTEDDVAYRLAVMLDKKEVWHRAAKATFASFLKLADQNTRPSVLGSVQSHLLSYKAV